MTDHVFGIDLGTSNSALAYLDALGTPQIKESDDGQLTTPSVVWFESETNTVVGKLAREEKLFSPKSVIDLVKRDMGTEKDWIFHGREYTPEAISALILRSLVSMVEDGPGKTPVVITVPAYFGAKEREATRNAGEIANLDVLNLVAEPVAAALFYDSQTPLKGKNLLVYDLGGGTFDVTAVRGEGDSFTIVATDGDARLGGADWDRVLSEHLMDRYIDETGDEDAENDDTFRLKLRDQAVACKEALSKSESFTVRLSSDTGGRAKINVTREEFNRLTAPLLQRTEVCFDRLLAAVEKKDPTFEFDEVILVGGSSRMTAVGELMQRRTGLIPQIFEPDLAIAKGAALSATISRLEKLAGAGAGNAERERAVREFAERSGIDAGQLEVLSTKRVLNVLPKAIGLMILDEDDKPYIDHLVPQNAGIPLAEPVSRIYETRHDGQTGVDLTLYQQASDVESIDPALNEVITGAETKLTGIPPLPAGQQIRVDLTVAGDGLISIYGTHIGSGKSVTADIRIGVMSEEQIAAARLNLRGMKVSQDEGA